ncbi:MAG: hypothetical protein R2836_06395 [Chitinophagales bacterium]
MAIVAYDIASDTYKATDKNYFKEAGVIEPNTRFDQLKFVSGDYFVVCYTNKSKEKGYGNAFFFLYFDKNTMNFSKKVVYHTTLESKWGTGFTLIVSENKKYLAVDFTELEVINKKEKQKHAKIIVLDVAEAKIFEVEDGSFSANSDFENKKTEYNNVQVSNEGDVFAEYSIKENYDGPLVSATGAGYKKINEELKKMEDSEITGVVKFTRDMPPAYKEVDISFDVQSYRFTWDNETKTLHCVYLGFLGEKETNSVSIYNSYTYIKYDKDLNQVKITAEEDFDQDLIEDANQGIEYNKIKDTNYGLTSFYLDDMYVLDSKPLLIFVHKVIEKTYCSSNFGCKDFCFYPSFLIVFLDEKGEVEDYSVVKRWNSDGGDDFGKELSLHKVLKNDGGVYILANFNNRFDPFDNEKKIEATQLAYCKISEDREIYFSKILDFKDANYLGLVSNVKISQLNEGNCVIKFQQENKGNVPDDIKKYKYFYGNIKLK